jgi:hypothetical protein
MFKTYQNPKLYTLLILALLLTTGLLVACGNTTATPTELAATTTVATQLTTATTTVAATTTVVVPTATAQATTVVPTATAQATTTVATTQATTVVPNGTIVPGNFQVGFAQYYAQAACPTDAASGALCISVKATAQDAKLGQLTVDRTVVVAVDDSPTKCYKATTTGTLASENGDKLNMNAAGQVCFSNGSAFYNYNFSGGTGKFKNVSGTGVITVPPPTDSHHGTETWSGNLNLAS